MANARAIGHERGFRHADRNRLSVRANANANADGANAANGNGDGVTDSVNVPVQVRTALRGIPVVNTQQILHKSSLDPRNRASTSEATGPSGC